MRALQRSNILFVGPLPPPVTGQAVSFQSTVKLINCGKKYVIDQNLENDQVLKKLFRTFFIVLKYFWFFLTKKIALVYFTNSRSLEGSMKDVVLILLAKAFRKKIINHIHGAELHQFIAGLPLVYRNLLKSAYRLIDCHVILLPGMIEQLSFLNNKAIIKTAPNFYDPMLDEYTVKKGAGKEIVIGYFSNILFSKGIMDLITAFKQLYNSNRHLRLVIAGDYRSDEYMNETEIERLVNEGIKDNTAIKYYGSIRGKDKAAFLSEIDIFVLPTYYKSEAFPISIVEAMKCGAIIITTEHNYLKSIINLQNGSLVPIKNPGAIVREIEKYVSDPLLRHRVSQFNIRHANDFFSITNYKNTINNIFETVAAS